MATPRAESLFVEREALRHGRERPSRLVDGRAEEAHERDRLQVREIKAFEVLPLEDGRAVAGMARGRVDDAGNPNAPQVAGVGKGVSGDHGEHSEVVVGRGGAAHGLACGNDADAVDEYGARHDPGRHEVDLDRRLPRG